jgi:hypothetical protein
MQPATPPPPVTPQPPAEPPAVAPAAMPAAPPPVQAAPVNWGGTPAPTGPDAGTQAQAQEAPKKANPWSFTRFTWTNSGSTKIFGVGADYIGTEDESYTMDFGLNVRYAFVNQPKDKVYVNLAGGVEVELTNSDISARLHEPLLRDTSLGLGYTHNLFTSADKETRTSVTFGAGMSLPTSLASRSIGKYLGTSVTAGLVHGQKLAGSKADWFQDILLFGTLNWGHNFTRGTTATNESTVITGIPRQRLCDAGGSCLTDGSDQLSKGFLTHDRLKLTALYYLDVYKDVVSIGNVWEIEEKYKYTPGGEVCQPLATGCAPVGHEPVAPTSRNVATTFDISISYAIPENLGRVDLGYVNTTGQLTDASTYRSVFYGPDSQFYVSLSAYIDGIYDKASSHTDKNNKQRVGSLPRFNAR